MANDEDLATLKRRRAIILGSCTRIRNFVDTIESLSPSVTAQLEERRSKMDGYWSEYDIVQTKIETRDETEAIHRATFEDAFYALAAKLRELLNPAISTNVTSTPSTSHEATTSQNHNHMKLPRLDLPKFSGKYHEWFPFFDSFLTLIHTNTSLSNIQRLQYLRASLTNEANDVISSLEISDANYEVAWNLLKERYDNKRVIIQNHIDAIIDLPSLTKENIAELRQLVSGANKHIHALQALKRPVAHWDDILVRILSRKLDTLTVREWRLSLTDSEMPTLKQFIDFIAHRCRTLETNNNKADDTSQKGVNTRSQSNAKRQSSCVATVKAKCGFCKGEHLIYYCQDFLALPISQRVSEIRKRKMCTNCLRSTDHSSNKYPSGNCKICKSKHNTLLHIVSSPSTRPAAATPHNHASGDSGEGGAGNAPAALVTHSSNPHNYNCVMLSTAVVYAYDSKGSRKSCRVLLDSGSQANFISRKFLEVLGLKTRALDISISGINKTATRSSQAAEVRLQSRTGSFTISLDCIVTDHVTDKLPAFSLKRDAFEIPQNIELADPHFHVSADIDILVGADHFWRLLCVGQIKSSSKHPTLHKTRFGWILAGQLSTLPSARQSVRSFHVSVSDMQLHDQLTSFWRVEEVAGISNNYNDEEIHCEQHFLQNISRTAQGRFIVRLPFKEHAVNTLGDSRSNALKRFCNLEKRLSRDPELKSQYSNFINEYLALHHMRQIDEQPSDDSESFYLPHHCVFKTTAGTSKIRVVFDASSKSWRFTK